MAKLSAADLTLADLTDARLGYAELGSAILRRAELRRADLTNANLSQANLRNAGLRNANLTGAELGNAQLAAADLTDAILLGADLVEADLSDAFLVRAVLSAANLRGARLNGARLADAKICRPSAAHGRANLVGSSLAGADLVGADLTGADLTNANLIGANFAEATLDDVVIGETHVMDVDATALARARDLQHSDPSFVDIRCVMRSYKYSRFRQFMIDSGAPSLFADYMIDCARSIGEGDIRAMLQSTFISYGGPDEQFARKLYDSLRSRQVITFFFPETAKVGERLHREMYRGVNEYDRVLLVCSASSLRRNGVLNEIEETFAREAKHGGATFLLPIRLDDYVINEWKELNPTLAERVLQRVIADFRGAESDDAKFMAALDRVIDALKVKPVPSSWPGAPSAAR